MYQAYLNELARAHYSEYQAKAHQGVRQRYAGDLANLFRMLLDDKSDAPYVEIAKNLVTADFHLYTHQLKELGSQEAQRLYEQNEALIKGRCRPNFVDPYWLVSLHELGLHKLLTHLSEFCETRTLYDSGIFEELAELPVAARRKLARVGMETIHQGYTHEFLNFAAGVALETGVTGAQFRRFMAVGMDKTRDHFARALILAIASQHATLPPAQTRYAVDSVWKFTQKEGDPKGFEPAFKAELTTFFRELAVPVHVFAHTAGEKDRLLGQDLGL